MKTGNFFERINALPGAEALDAPGAAFLCQLGTTPAQGPRSRPHGPEKAATGYKEHDDG